MTREGYRVVLWTVPVLLLVSVVIAPQGPSEWTLLAVGWSSAIFGFALVLGRRL